jgi:hypothetical protein
MQNCFSAIVKIHTECNYCWTLEGGGDGPIERETFVREMSFVRVYHPLNPGDHAPGLCPRL